MILLKELILRMTDPKPSKRPVASKIYENFLKNTQNLFEAQNSSTQGQGSEKEVKQRKKLPIGARMMKSHSHVSNKDQFEPS